jgi:hypothetical protein
VLADGSGLQPAAHTEQASVCPSAEGGGIGRARRILAVRRRLLHGGAGGDVLTGLLSAPQGERRRRYQPIGQDGEGLPAGMTDSASHPNVFVVFIVGLAEPSSMPDDRVVLAKGTSPRQEVEGDHPGSMLSFASGSAIKRITAGVKARRWFSLPGLLRRPAFTLLVYSLSNERKKAALNWRPQAPHSGHWPV